MIEVSGDQDERGWKKNKGAAVDFNLLRRRIRWDWSSCLVVGLMTP